MSRLRWYRIWECLAWLAVLLLILVCLLPMPQIGPEVAGGDKFQHLLSYFLLTWAHGQLGLSQRQFLLRALGLFVLGMAIELAQGLTGYRSSDPADVLANAVGIAFGVMIALAAPGYLLRFEQRFLRGKSPAA